MANELFFEAGVEEDVSATLRDFVTNHPNHQIERWTAIPGDGDSPGKIVGVAYHVGPNTRSESL